MIKKIMKIENLGIFKKYEEKTLNEFKKQNLIYGWNSSGKTTMSKLFGALATGHSEEFPDLKYKIRTSELSHEINENAPYDKSICETERIAS